jgi:hypothetical protein
MSTFQITIPESLAERMTSEEIQHFLQKQIEHLSESNDVDIFSSTSQVGENKMFSERLFENSKKGWKKRAKPAN